jgi:DNA-binding NtrC family response regulator
MHQILRTPDRPPSVLVVDSHAGRLATTVEVLRGAGYQVETALGFEQGRRSLDNSRPELLITAVRLGPYNGLHLIVRSRGNRPTMPAILTHDTPDPVLETDARKQDAAYLLQPCRDDEFLALVRESIAAARESQNH